jgi:hypothetical protein
MYETKAQSHNALQARTSILKNFACSLEEIDKKFRTSTVIFFSLLSNIQCATNQKNNVENDMTDWQEIVRQNGPMVWRIVYRLLNQDADSRDCFQQTFLSAVE